MYTVSKRHPDSVNTAWFPLNGHILKQASLSPLGINLIEHMYVSSSHQTDSVGTVRFPLNGDKFKKASLALIGISLIKYVYRSFDLILRKVFLILGTWFILNVICCYEIYSCLNELCYKCLIWKWLFKSCISMQLIISVQAIGSLLILIGTKCPKTTNSLSLIILYIFFVIYSNKDLKRLWKLSKYL